MTKTIFIASTEPYSGKSVITLGLIHILLGKARKVGYFKPIINNNPSEKADVHIQTVISHFGLPITFNDAYAFTRQEAMRLQVGEMIEAVISKFKKIEENNDFTIIEGSDFTTEGKAFEAESNILIARNLGAPALLVVSGENKTKEQVMQDSRHIVRSFRAREITVLGIVVNKVNPADAEEIKQALLSQLPGNISVIIIPEDKGLKNPTFNDIYQNLNGKLLFGEEYLMNQVDHFVTGAMQVPKFLNYLKENVLIVTPGDRGDIIIAALQANLSSNYSKIAGIVLSADCVPEEPIMRLIEGSQNTVPIMAVKTGTFETITEIASVNAGITPDNPKKIRLAIDTFEKYIDVADLEKKIDSYNSETLTPHMFQYMLGQRARQQIKHIVLPEGDDDRILKATARLLAQDIVRITLLGNTEEIQASIKRLGLQIDLEKLNIINPLTSPLFEDYAQTLYELRKSKNVTLEMARDLMSDVSYFGTMMVYKGDADGMVSGANHTTQHTIRPALQFIKTKPGISTVSSVFFMCLEDRVCVFGDCAVNPNPTAEQLSEIAISSAETSAAFGITPRVAMLSYSSGNSGSGQDVEKVREATTIVKSKRPEMKVEGPIQYDAAVDPITGSQKMPGSEVAGQASVLIFPDLNTGNNTYKAVQRETGALAIGPVLQGLNKPVNDLSRGCTVDDIFNTVIITAIQSQ